MSIVVNCWYCQYVCYKEIANSTIYMYLQVTVINTTTWRSKVSLRSSWSPLSFHWSRNNPQIANVRSIKQVVFRGWMVYACEIQGRVYGNNDMTKHSPSCVSHRKRELSVNDLRFLKNSLSCICIFVLPLYQIDSSSKIHQSWPNHGRNAKHDECVGNKLIIVPSIKNK